MTDRLDGYLSRLAQHVAPSATVISRHPQNTWHLLRAGLEDVQLGTRVPSSYGDALDALHAWVRAEKAKGHPLPCRNCGCLPCAPTCVIGDPVGRKK